MSPQLGLKRTRTRCFSEISVKAFSLDINLSGYCSLRRCPTRTKVELVKVFLILNQREVISLKKEISLSFIVK